MLYFIICIINVIALIPFIYGLAGYVYDQPSHKLSLLRILPRGIYIGTFCFLFGFWCAFSIVLLWNIGELTPMNARLDIGCSVLGACAIYFVRCIPIYYREGSTVQSPRNYRASFWKEVVLIVLITGALEVVSFNLYAYLISAGIGVSLLLLRIRKRVELYKKYKGKKK